MKRTKEIEMRTYGKKELAEAYGISIDCLRSRIIRNKQLIIELKAIGNDPEDEAHKYRQVYTPAEVRLIVQFI